MIQCRLAAGPGQKRATGLLQGPYKCEGQKTSRGEQLLRRNWEEKPPCASAMCDMVVFCAVNNTLLCRPAMREPQCFRLKGLSGYISGNRRAAESPEFQGFRGRLPARRPPSEIPVTGFADYEVTEDFQLRGVLHFIRIAEIGVEGRDVGVDRQLNQSRIPTDDIIRQAGNPYPQQAGALDRGLAVDLQVRRAGIVR